ncbi:uncharacterized protein [Dermacentor andersoni]
MLPCVWCPELRPLEPAQMPIRDSITSRSLVHTVRETVPRSMRQWVKERSDLQDFVVTYTNWERKSLSISVIHREDGRHALHLHPFNPRTLPPDVKSEYPVLHANDHCVIIGEYPQPGRMADCFFWAPQSKVTGTNFECDFIWNNYCTFRIDVPFDRTDCP